MKTNNYQDKIRVGDYVIFCQICGMKCWASQSTILASETGRGGLIVCPVDRDAIDPGLVPFKVLPEDVVPFSTSNHYASNPSDVPTQYTVYIDDDDFTTIDPMSISNPATDY